MPVATINGIDTNYEILGDGPPLLMYSPGGFDASMDKWSNLGVYARTRMLAHLQGAYRCIIFDRRETGQSGGRVERLGWADYVDQGRGLLSHLGIERAHIMGGCMGCCPVAAHAARYPQSVLSMILYWPVGGAKFRLRAHERFRQHLALVESGGLTGVVEAARSSEDGFGKLPKVGPWAPVIRRDPGFAKAYSEMDADHYKMLVTVMSRTLIDRDTAPGAEPEELLQLDIPALIVPGSDVAHATSSARYLQECLPASQYWDVEPDDQTEQTVPTRLLDFLGEATPR